MTLIENKNNLIDLLNKTTLFNKEINAVIKIIYNTLKKKKQSLYMWKWWLSWRGPTLGRRVSSKAKS